MIEEERCVEDNSWKLLDVTGPRSIEIHISDDGKRIWVNDEIKCLLRICKIKLLILRDDRFMTTTTWNTEKEDYSPLELKE